MLRLADHNLIFLLWLPFVLPLCVIRPFNTSAPQPVRLVKTARPKSCAIARRSIKALAADWRRPNGARCCSAASSTPCRTFRTILRRRTHATAS
eukprot:6177488-Pleurochrysis_carterae.AAC.1